MIYDEIQKLKDKKNADFQARLIPDKSKDFFLGTRTPLLRKLAKKLVSENSYQEFITTLPHSYFDEYMLHGLIISEIKDFDLCIRYLNDFLPYIDNWAVCDSLFPKIFNKNKIKLIPLIKSCIYSNETYSVRFGIEMIMKLFLDSDFNIELFNLPKAVHSDEYYVNMMLAWFYATGLAKQWDVTINVLESKELSVWVHNKTIQKAIESFRITNEQKSYLKTLKIKEKKQ